MVAQVLALRTHVRKKSDLTSHEERQARLMERRNLKMASSPHAYVRGNTQKFYAWLKTANGLSLPKGPHVWICGDCHVGNLGPIANTKGKIRIQIRDLDQAVIGNPTHDLIRLALSLASAARGSDLPGVTTAKILEEIIQGYEQAFADVEEDSFEDVAIPESVQLTMKDALRRKWKHLAKERIENTEPTIPLGKRFWPLSREEKHEIKALFGEEKVRRLITSLRSRDDNASVTVVDAAYWVKGCSSLGILRYAILLAVDGADDLCLMDIKEAVPAVAPHYPRVKMPRDDAERVVEGARNTSPALGNRMVAAKLRKRPVFMRELLPQDLKFEIEHLTRDEAMKTARFLALIVGKAHGRQMDAATRKAWLHELECRHSKKLNAPSWLWSSVVELLVSHEGAYLEHCRKYALSTDAETE
jgi:uncharacterized protein (DUF2252 family)